MNNKIITINNQEMNIKEYNGKRVVTFKDIDMVHQRADGTARKRFNDNKDHFIEGEDYFNILMSEKRTLDFDVPNRGLTVLTESGYLMLVKSFTDDLAWNVQRQLVNSYFRVKEITKSHKESTDKSKALEVKEMNARVRMSNQFLKLAKVDTLSEQYKNILVAKAAEVLTGESILALPKSEQKTYSATEVGEMLGITSQRIGRLANEYGLKIDEYGAWYHDKSPYSNKEIDTFRYNDKAIECFKQIISDKTCT